MNQIHRQDTYAIDKENLFLKKPLEKGFKW